VRLSVYISVCAPSRIMHMPDRHILKQVFHGQLAASAMWASLMVQRRSESQHEAVQHGLVSSQH